MIKAVIFDMDGLLIDSEPFWRQAAVEVFNELGAPVTTSMMSRTMGMRVDEVAHYWHRKYPWEGVSITETAERINKRVGELITQNGEMMPGVKNIIQFFAKKNLPMAIASSSSLILIDTVMNKLGVTKDISVVCSAQNESHGKPHPAVFLKTLEELDRFVDSDIHAENCLVFEDSVNGVISAKAAKMHCVAIPDQAQINDKRFGVADVTLDSLAKFNAKTFEQIK